MKDPIPFRNQRTKRSAALVIVLLALVLLSIVVGTLLVSTGLESSISHQDYNAQVARTMATTGLNSAIAQIRTALGPWDDPYNNFCGGIASSAPPTFYWSVSPGIISRWSYTSTTPQTNYPLFSQPASWDTRPSLVNLNAPNRYGVNPIMGGASAPALQVYWANVLQYPNAAPNATNQIMGRYAYWVDDESAKINLNTADGTLKYQTNSLGLGSPSEVSLQALQQGGTSSSSPTNLPLALASNIVYIARTTGFNSAQEILRATNSAASDLYTNNVFNITCSSRSPDLNIFGQPKMAMLPVLGASANPAAPWLLYTNMEVNGITLQPLKEIYPTPSQLPTVALTEPYYHSTVRLPWPLAFRQLFGPYNVGCRYGEVGVNDSAYLYTLPNYAWNNGNLLSHYLAGTNSMGQQITWPPFPGTVAPAAGFAGKYTPRQIDSLVTQIVELGAKDISPDIFYSTDPVTTYTAPLGWAQSQYMPARGRRTIIAPFIFLGWLSNKYVSGVGRSPKVDSLLVEYTTYGSINSFPGTSAAPYSPPRMTTDIWLEWWLPSAYQGGYNVLPINDGNPIDMGDDYTSGLNMADQSSYVGDITQLYYNMEQAGGRTGIPRTSSSVYPAPQYNFYPASIPKADFTSPNFWSDQLLSNNQGIDFQANDTTENDPDQTKALQNHDPYSWTNFGGSGAPAPYPYPGSYGPYQGTNGTYAGAEIAGYHSIFCTPLYIGQLQQPAPYVPQDWAPGELRNLRSLYGYIQLPMKTSADGGTLNMGGGMTVRTTYEGGGLPSDLDLVPLDAIRGNTFGPTSIVNGTMTCTDNAGSQGYSFDQEIWSANAGLPSNPTATVRDLALGAVIPAGASIQIPGNSNGSEPGITEWVLSRVADPLVNKFPGDWIETTNAAPPATTMEYSTVSPPPTYEPAAITSYTSYDEYSSGFHTNLTDPDSYWMPQLDCAISYPADLASQTLIPRSARMPNIGYLQYLRTGVIPDDETQPYSTQHGAPFRLVSYAPSTEAANQTTTRPSTSYFGAASKTYPDWAMLDLLYVPSQLAPYGGPYGYYDTNSPPVWQGYGNPGTLASYSTGGGSTPGRINPNGSVIYTTNSTIPLPGVSRLLPTEAVLQGLMVNQSLNQNPIDTTLPSYHPNPGWSGGTAVDAPTIAQAIQSYIASNGPLSLPGEIANVPAVAGLRPSVNATRNDLVRQIVGALTTQSNVFSVWSVGQTIKKSVANHVNFGLFEAGDTVLAESRFHYIVERYLDPGADGVYGNGPNPGPVGTYDDPVDPINHPYCPHYLYRVIYAEEIL